MYEEHLVETIINISSLVSQLLEEN